MWLLEKSHKNKEKETGILGPSVTTESIPRPRRVVRVATGGSSPGSAVAVELPLPFLEAGVFAGALLALRFRPAGFVVVAVVADLDFLGGDSGS